MSLGPTSICLWSLQDDKDLVPEFVASEGLTCFIKVGAEADHNYQNYILRGEAPPTTQCWTLLWTQWNQN